MRIHVLYMFFRDWPYTTLRDVFVVQGLAVYRSAVGVCCPGPQYSGLGTQNSELRARDSELRTQDSELRT